MAKYARRRTQRRTIGRRVRRTRVRRVRRGTKKRGGAVFAMGGAGPFQSQGQTGGKNRMMGRSMSRGIAGGAPVFGL
jgi:hypothetical protein